MTIRPASVETSVGGQVKTISTLLVCMYVYSYIRMSILHLKQGKQIFTLKYSHHFCVNLVLKIWYSMHVPYFSCRTGEAVTIMTEK